MASDTIVLPSKMRVVSASITLRDGTTQRLDVPAREFTAGDEITVVLAAGVVRFDRPAAAIAVDQRRASWRDGSRARLSSCGSAFAPSKSRGWRHLIKK